MVGQENSQEDERTLDAKQWWEGWLGSRKYLIHVQVLDYAKTYSNWKKAY